MRAILGALCALVVVGIAPAAALAAFDDPLFLMRPAPPPPAKPPNPQPPRLPPISGVFEGPCGVAVDNEGQVYVSDYYHHNVDLFSSGLGPEYPYGYLSQTANVAPADGPCALTIDGGGSVYVNEFHRSVFRLATGEVITGAPIDSERPTGVAADKVSERLYVDDRDHIAVFTTAGEPLGQIGAGNLEDGYGVAVSRFHETEGWIYVPDAATGTVKVYEPTIGGTVPVEEIDGSELPGGGFTSLRDSGVAVDDVTGEVYVVDVLEPEDAEHPEAVIRVFGFDGTYEGRLKYSVSFGQPVGLAVDNSPTANQGRVYVTTDNTESAALYAYRPGSATTNAVPLPPAGPEGSPEPPSALLSAIAPATGAAAVIQASTESQPATSAAARNRASKRRRAKHRHRQRRNRHR